MRRRRILLLCGERGIPLQTLYCLNAAGVETHVLAGARGRGLRYSRYCKTFTLAAAPFDEQYAAVLAEQVDALARDKGVDCVGPGGGLATALLSTLQQRLTSRCFPLPNATMFARMNDKWSFYQMCRQADVAAPLALHVGPKAGLDLDLVSQEFGFPAVIKPTNHGNGQGVAIVHSREDALHRVVNNPSYRYDSLMVQQFVEGQDIDCSVLAHEGKVALAAVQIRRGSRITFIPNRELIDACSRLVAQAGYTGLAHFDARLDARDGKARLVECNPRVWASISAAARCGLNFVAKGIEIAVGNPPGGLEVLDRGYYINPTRLTSQLLRGREWSSLLQRRVLAGLWQAYSDPITLIQHEIASHGLALRNRRELLRQ